MLHIFKASHIELGSNELVEGGSIGDVIVRPIYHGSMNTRDKNKIPTTRIIK